MNVSRYDKSFVAFIFKKATEICGRSIQTILDIRHTYMKLYIYTQNIRIL